MIPRLADGSGLANGLPRKIACKPYGADCPLGRLIEAILHIFDKMPLRFGTLASRFIFADFTQTRKIYRQGMLT